VTDSHQIKKEPQAAEDPRVFQARQGLRDAGAAVPTRLLSDLLAAYDELARRATAQDPPNAFLLVADLYMSGGDCAIFWTHGCSGYTHDISRAHVFSEEEAWGQHTSRPGVDLPIPLRVARLLGTHRVSRDALQNWLHENRDPRTVGKPR
jgi:hypothetical protein